MLRRYHITLGATTTADGKVITASAPCTINGAKLALEDDKVWCPQCNSEGVIKLDGPRISERWNGRQAALNDDLCICKCSPPPRLVNSQTHKSQVINAEWHVAEVAKKFADVRTDTTTSQSSPAAQDELPLLLLRPDTNEPYRHRSYKLQLKDKIIEGTTDEHGATRPLSAAERASVLTWRVDDVTSEA